MAVVYGSFGCGEWLSQCVGVLVCVWGRVGEWGGGELVAGGSSVDGEVGGNVQLPG